MRLYSKTGATLIDAPEGKFTPNAHGAFDGLPDRVYADLHGRPDWESQDERDLRLAREEIDRFRDPAELLKAVKELGANQGLLTQALSTALGLVPATPSAANEQGEAEAPAVESEGDADESDQAPGDPALADQAEAQPAPKRTRKSAAAKASASE